MRETLEYWAVVAVRAVACRLQTRVFVSPNRINIRHIFRRRACAMQFFAHLGELFPEFFSSHLLFMQSRHAFA